MQKSFLSVDELVALIILVLSMIFHALPFAGTLSTAAFLYLLMCVFFRKYVAVQQQLHGQKDSPKKSD